MTTPAHRNVVVVGASAGGVEALTALCAGLPAGLEASVLVVLHVPRTTPSALPKILDRAGPLRAAHANDGEDLLPGRIYVAPSDYHLVVHRGCVRLSRGPTENGHRPAIDPLFRSAARAHGARVIAVILSGSLDDGSAGLAVVRARGGTTIVQDPDETPFSGMAMSVLDDGGADYVVPVADIGPLVAQLVGEELPAEATMDHDGYDEVELDPDGLANERTGAPSPFACPDCNGVLWEEPESAPLRFRCRVGHAWTAESLVAEQSQEVETALWAAVRMLQEKAALSRRLAQRSHQRGRERSAARFHDQEREARRLSDTIERIIGEGTAQQGNTRDNEASGN